MSFEDRRKKPIVQVYRLGRYVVEAKQSEKVPAFKAWFHGFGVNFEELETGVGNYTVAILERDDGAIVLEPAENVEFLQPGEPAWDEAVEAFRDAARAKAKP